MRVGTNFFKKIVSGVTISPKHPLWFGDFNSNRQNHSHLMEAIMAKLQLRWRKSVDEKGSIWRARTSTELFSSRIHPSEVSEWERSDVDTADGLAVIVPAGESIAIDTSAVSLETPSFIKGLLDS